MCTDILASLIITKGKNFLSKLTTSRDESVECIETRQVMKTKEDRPATEKL